MINLGEKIRSYRIEKGWTQAQLAEKCQMTRSQICCFESGKTEPSSTGLTVIANVFGITPNDLLDDQIRTPHFSTESTLNIIRFSSEVDPYQLRLFADFIESIQSPKMKTGDV